MKTTCQCPYFTVNQISLNQIKCSPFIFDFSTSTCTKISNTFQHLVDTWNPSKLFCYHDELQAFRSFPLTAVRQSSICLHLSRTHTHPTPLGQDSQHWVASRYAQRPKLCPLQIQNIDWRTTGEDVLGKYITNTRRPVRRTVSVQ